MSWRNIGWGLGHLVRELVDVAGIGAIKATHAWENPTLMPWFLVDDRAQALARFATAEPDHLVEAAFSSATTSTLCYIPAGHNLDGVDVRLLGGAATPPATVLQTVTAVAGEPIIFEAISGGWAGTASWQYWGTDFQATGQWELPEWVLSVVSETGVDEATSRGPEPRYREEPLDNTELIPYESGAQAALTLGPAQIQADYTYPNLTRGQAAHDVFNTLRDRHGTRHPFLMRPSGENDLGWRWMYQITEQTRVQGKDAPAAQDAISDTISVRAVENTA